MGIKTALKKATRSVEKAITGEEPEMDILDTLAEEHEVVAALLQDLVDGKSSAQRASALKQINRKTVHNLKQVWRFDSGDEYEGSELQCNPIVVGGVLYAATPRLRIVALDAGTGKLLWDFDPRKGESPAAYS